MSWLALHIMDTFKNKKYTTDASYAYYIHIHISHVAIIVLTYKCHLIASRLNQLIVCMKLSL